MANSKLENEAKDEEIMNTGLEDMETNAEMQIIEEETKDEEETKIEALIEEMLDEGEADEEEDYWKQHTLREHIYKTEEGKNYMRMLKTDSEDYTFIPQRYEDGKFVTGTKGMKYIPYNLPELMKAVKEGKVIFITNGEKDADTLMQLGFTATTAPFSIAGKWNNVCNKYIKNAKVIIIREISQAGIDFAVATHEKVRRVANKSKKLLIEKVCKVLDIEPDFKTDITDIRKELQDDEKLKRLFKCIEETF